MKFKGPSVLLNLIILVDHISELIIVLCSLFFDESPSLINITPLGLSFDIQWDNILF